MVIAENKNQIIFIENIFIKTYSFTLQGVFDIQHHAFLPLLDKKTFYCTVGFGCFTGSDPDSGFFC